jgi:mannose-P-dolichol utilization defect protein 1
MFVLELFGFVFQGSYAIRHELPLDSFLEVWTIMIQNFFIVLLIYRLTTGIHLEAIALVCLILSICLYELTVAPLSVVAALQMVSIGIFTVAKAPQIFKVFREQSTGQLDLFMLSMQTLGTTIRVFTTLEATTDRVYLLSYLIGMVLDATLMGQILYYRRKDIE